MQVFLLNKGSQVRFLRKAVAVFSGRILCATERLGRRYLSGAISQNTCLYRSTKSLRITGVYCKRINIVMRCNNILAFCNEINLV